MHSLNRRTFLAAATAAAGAALLPESLSAATTKPRRFELGLVTYNVAKDWDLPTILKVCREVGLAAVECRTTHRHGVEPSLTAEERRDVKQRFTDSGVRFWGCGSTCEFHSPDPQVVRSNIDECRRFIDLVADLGGSGVKVRPNGLPKEVPVEKTLEQIGTALTECGKAAADAGIDICVEVHGPGTQEPRHMETMMRHCDHRNVGITWNSNPTDLQNGSIAESFAALRPWLRSCHINELGNDASGKYPYRELFRLLRESDYDRFTLIEIGQAYPDVAQGTEFLIRYKAQWEQLANG